MNATRLFQKLRVFLKKNKNAINYIIFEMKAISPYDAKEVLTLMENVSR